jgi:hypothetical protein
MNLATELDFLAYRIVPSQLPKRIRKIAATATGHAPHIDSPFQYAEHVQLRFYSVFERSNNLARRAAEEMKLSSAVRYSASPRLVLLDPGCDLGLPVL